MRSPGRFTSASCLTANPNANEPGFRPEENAWEPGRPIDSLCRNGRLCGVGMAGNEAARWRRTGNLGRRPLHGHVV